MGQGRNKATPNYRLFIKDVAWALFLAGLAWLGVAAAIDNAAERRAERQAISAFDARMPKSVGEAPYNPATRERIVCQAAGSVLVLALIVCGFRLRRHAAGPRSKWATATRPKAAVGARAAPRWRRRKSGAIAAERLLAVVRTDHVARQEKEVA